MGSLTIHFEGICTQIQLPPPVDSLQHRVVLVDASKQQTLNNEVIPPHLAFLSMDPDQCIVAADLGNVPAANLIQQGNSGCWQMLGIGLSVTNAVAGTVTYDKWMKSVPSLTTLTPDFGPLSLSVVYGSNAACHFDVTSGAFTAAQSESLAWYSILTVTTSDENPILQVNSLAYPDQSGTLTLNSGSTITVSNTGGGLVDKKYDFYLHYLTARTWPLSARLPPEVEALVATGAGSDTPLPTPTNFSTGGEALGPGCSNSNWP